MDIQITEEKKASIDVDFIKGETLVNLTFRKTDIHSLVQILVALRRLK